MKLAKLGYYGGDPDKVLHAPFATVMAILSYEKFDYQYAVTYHELNKVVK